ncbi:Uncharacterized protein PBTT_08718 [Plasmodiophora brassicae]
MTPASLLMDAIGSWRCSPVRNDVATPKSALPPHWCSAGNGAAAAAAAASGGEMHHRLGIRIVFVGGRTSQLGSHLGGPSDDVNVQRAVPSCQVRCPIISLRLSIFPVE